MTANEQRYEFDVLCDKITSFSNPGYTDREVGVLLTKAQEIYYKDGFEPYKSFEETEKRRKDFSEIKEYITPTLSVTQTGVHPNGYFFDLPSNLLYTLKEEVVTVSSDVCKNGKRIMVKPVTEDEYNINIRNPHKKPYCLDGDGLVWRMDFNDGRHELITDGTFTIGTYHLRYLRKPQDIIPLTGDGSTTVQQNCELNTNSHRPITEIAVRIATGITKPQEYQIKVNEEKTNE